MKVLLAVFAITMIAGCASVQQKTPNLSGPFQGEEKSAIITEVGVPPRAEIVSGTFNALIWDDSHGVRYLILSNGKCVSSFPFLSGTFAEASKSIKNTLKHLEDSRIASERADAEASTRRREYVEAHKALSEPIKASILVGGFRLGMTREQVEVSLGYQLSRRSRHVNALGVLETLETRGKSQLYFNNGVLISFTE